MYILYKCYVHYMSRDRKIVARFLIGIDGVCVFRTHKSPGILFTANLFSEWQLSFVNTFLERERSQSTNISCEKTQRSLLLKWISYFFSRFEIHYTVIATSLLKIGFVRDTVKRQRQRAFSETKQKLRCDIL